MTLQVTQLSKHYGTQKAVDNISFSITKGEIVGILGANGAGKSTTLRIIAGAIDADQGTVTINQITQNSRSTSLKRTIGYLPENNPLYPSMLVREYLSFVAKIYKAPLDRIEEYIIKTGLVDETAKQISQLSKGYKQRVGIAATLLIHPSVIILDEPTTGLDPNQVADLRKLIREESTERIILFSSHQLAEVEELCSRCLIFKKGKIVADLALDTLRQKGQTLSEQFAIASR